jgi:eukaryotic-like serine/threonine-protein kinase
LIGQTLGHYRITAPLGAGGMGEVYRATDTKLRREVAIKVLPPELAHDRDRLARFQREALLLASLNHPNIAAIHGLEEADGKPLLVLELVEGEDLKELLMRGALSLEEALEIAIQIAEALEEAHSKNIVHRDLKPANVRVTPGGKVKVLDFGLARAWAGAESSAAATSQSLTQTEMRTAAGAVLGTAAYMAPEQARGKPVDERADVWSFGVLLGEMLTATPLFSGGSAADVIAAVMTKEPNLETLPVTTPPEVRRLLERCLRKDPRTRWPDIGAARLVLQDALAGKGNEAETPRAAGEEIRIARPRRTLERWAWLALVIAVVGIASLRFLPRPTDAPEERPNAHFVFDIPDGVTLGEFDPLAVSPDGRSIVFAASSRLWTRSLDAPAVRQLPGTEGGGQPFWSPDSASIGFFAGGELKKLALGSGTVLSISALPHQSSRPSGTWGENSIVFSLGGTGGLFSVPAAGGEATPLTTPDEGTHHWWPQFLPDGRRFIFEIFGLQKEIAGAHAENAGVFVGSLGAPDERRRLLPVPMRTRYASGHLLFVQDGSTLMAQPFDVEGAELAGDPVGIASAVGSGMVPRWGWFSASSTGILSYVEGLSGEVQLMWLDRAGERLATLGEPRAYRQISLSPDGSRVAVVVIAGTGLNDIWAIDVARGMTSRVTSGPHGASSPIWSPEGGELIYDGSRAGRMIFYRKEPRASAVASVVRDTAERGTPEAWSPDGAILLYRTFGAENALWALDVEGTGEPELLLKSEFSFLGPQISPDARWLAYLSDESGRYEVFVEPFRRPGERVRVSRDGGGQPRWRGDGKELFYLSHDGRLMVAAVGEGASGAEVGMPEVLIPAEALRAVIGAPGDEDYAVTPDGQRFLFKTRVGQEEKQRIHVVTNWTSLLE